VNSATGDEPIRLSIDVDDPALARRIVALLSNVEGVVLVGAGEPSDVTVLSSRDGDMARDHSQPLTARELEVLALLAEGASNKMIARRLGISTHTAKFHVASVIDKLDAVGRTDAVTHAVRLGVIQL
jgi:DNA-binding CsgD family transcriptional regulator